MCLIRQHCHCCSIFENLEWQWTIGGLVCWPVHNSSDITKIFFLIHLRSMKIILFCWTSYTAVTFIIFFREIYFYPFWKLKLEKYSNFKCFAIVCVSCQISFPRFKEMNGKRYVSDVCKKNIVISFLFFRAVLNRYCFPRAWFNVTKTKNNFKCHFNLTQIRKRKQIAV